MKRHFTALAFAALAAMLFAASLPAHAGASETTTASGICDRTLHVRTAILSELAGVNDCAAVTDADLLTVTSISLRQVGLTSLKSGDFAGLANLTSANLSQNQLRELPDGIFDDLAKLTTLRMSRNRVESLPSDLFTATTSLTELDLEYNDLRELPAGIFEDLGSLEKLKLGDNEFQRLPNDAFSDLSQLNWLSLSNTGLRELPAGIFDDLTSLKVLDLMSNELESLPAGVFDENSALESLYLGHNNLTTLPAGIFDNQRVLLSLSLQGNQISEIPPGLFSQLRRLDTLLLFNNEIDSLPSGVFEGLVAELREIRQQGTIMLRGNPGAPFELTVELVHVEGNSFKVRIEEGAPFAVEVNLSADGGTPSTRQLTIWDGAVESAPASIELDAGAVSATVRLDSVRFTGPLHGESLITSPFNPAHEYSGIGLAMGERLTIGDPGTNSQVFGRPIVNGQARVGSELAVSTSDIRDDDGLASASFEYHWLRDDGTTITEISGATSQTYTVTDSDAGKHVRARVAFDDDAGNRESVSSSGTDAILPGNVPGPPQALTVVSRGSSEIQIRWASPGSDGGSDISGYRVQWRNSGYPFGPNPISATQFSYGEFLTTQGLATSHEFPVAYWTGDDPYEVRVIAVNANGDGIPSDVLQVSPLSHTEKLHARIDSFASDYGTEHPWLSTTWDKLQSDDTPVIGGSAVVAGGRFYRTCSPTADNGLVSCDTLRIVIQRFSIGNTPTIVHELAHAYTLANDMSDNPGPLGVAYLYFASLGLHETDPFCRPDELYADVVTLVTLGGGFGTTYWDNCGGDTQEAKDVVRAAIGGDMPQWLDDNYGDQDGTLDLKQLWTDVLALAHHRTSVVYQLRNEFGGYCNEQNTAAAARGDNDMRNPWRNGGCVPHAPADLQASEVVGALELTWNEPAQDGGSPIERYVVEWESLDTDSDGTVGSEQIEQSSVTVNDAAAVTHTIAGLEDGVEYEVRVNAYNLNGDGAVATTTGTPASSNSLATGAPTISGTPQVGETLSAVTAGIGDADGLTGAVFEYQWFRETATVDAAIDGAIGRAFASATAGLSEAIDGATGSAYTLGEADADTSVNVRVRFVDDGGSSEELTSDTVLVPRGPVWSAELAVGEAQTSVPVIAGYLLHARKGSLSDRSIELDGSSHGVIILALYGDDLNLVLDRALPGNYTLSIGDREFVTNDSSAPFAISYLWEDTGLDWNLGDVLDISLEEANGSAAERPKAPPGARASNVPSSHDGQARFVFRIYITEHMPLSYRTLRDHAIEVTNGTVRQAKRVRQGVNRVWDITIEPTSDDAITIVLPETTDCEASGAICAEDGRMLRNSIEFTVPGPTGNP